MGHRHGYGHGGTGGGQKAGPAADRGSGQAAGPGGECVCPTCGHREPHVAGQPCTEKKCPQCSTALVRE